MIDRAVLGELRRKITPELYTRIRDLWTHHSIAEDNRDIPGLMATLTQDCVYELPQTGDRWEGHAGATHFYEGLLGAYPDVKFALTHIVIGPQGVWEEATLTGTHTKDWLSFKASGQRVQFQVLIFFPWDPDEEKFKGERVFVDRVDLLPAPAA